MLKKIIKLLLLSVSTLSLAQEIVRDDKVSISVRSYPAISEAASACAPLAVLSHGAGGSEEGLAYIAEALAQKGWQVFVPRHQESDRAAVVKTLIGVRLKGGLDATLRQITSTSSHYKKRLEDISAVLAYATQQADAAHCVIPKKVLLGHSMGAATVMMEAGAKNQMDVTGQDRFDAYVAISPQGVGAVFPEQAWQSVQKPLLSITGTQDHALEGDWQTRVTLFSSLPKGCHWQAVIDSASHLNLAGNGFSFRVKPQVLALIEPFLQALPNCAGLVQSEGVLLKSDH